MKDLFTIGETASLFNVNIRTLRYYDKIGLLRPEWVDPDTGYRYYSTKQFERLNTILYLKALKVPLEKISFFFKSKNTDVMKSLLEEQRKNIRSLISELEIAKKKIGSRIAQIDYALEAPVNKIDIKHISDRPVFYLKKDMPVSDDLEYPIRELESVCPSLPGIFLGKVGVRVSMENLIKRDFSSFSGIFVMAETGEDMKCSSVIPGGDYIVMRFTGTHSFSGAYYARMLEYAEKNRFSVAGDSVEITLIDSGMTSDPDRFVTELQIPVEF